MTKNKKGGGASSSSVLLFFCVVGVSLIALDFYNVIGDIMKWGALVVAILLGLCAIL